MAQKGRYTINHRGLSVGEHHIRFDFAEDIFEPYVDCGVNGGSGAVEIDLVKHANMMELDVSIRGIVEVECDRCLGEYEQEVSFAGSVVVKVSEMEGEYDGDIIWVSPTDGEVDMQQWIFESIILSLPIQRVHSSKSECDPEALKYLTEDNSEINNNNE